MPTLYGTEAELQAPVGPYRTTVTIRGTDDLARLKKMGVTILASTRTSATVIADRLQLEQLPPPGVAGQAARAADVGVCAHRGKCRGADPWRKIRAARAEFRGWVVVQRIVEAIKRAGEEKKWVGV